jgi:hypothetical protein
MSFIARGTLIAGVASTQFACSPLAPQVPSAGERELARASWDEHWKWRGSNDLEDRIRRRAEFLPPWYRSAPDFCRNLQVQANRSSVRYATGGWALGLLGLAASGVGVAAATADAPDPFADASWKATMGATAGLGAAAAIFGAYWLTRSSAADRASAASVRVLAEPIGNENSEASWKTCIEARAAWSEANGAASDVARKAIMDRLDGKTEAAAKPDAAKADPPLEKK